MAPRILSIIGRKNAGKTTLTVALAAEFVRRGKRVMSLKHTHHPVDADRKDSDSWRHFHEGHAERVVLAGPNGRAVFERAADDYDPLALARRFLSDADIILAEGYRSARLPKIEVYRQSENPAPLYDAASPYAGEWIAVVTDDAHFDAPCRVLRFNDTMWLQLLANIAWERALPLHP